MYIYHICVFMYIIHTCIYNIDIYTYIYIIHIYVYIERKIHVDICIHEIIQVTMKTSDFTLQNKQPESI